MTETLTLNNLSFTELTQNEIQLVDGGSLLTNVLIGAGSGAITFGGVGAFVGSGCGAVAIPVIGAVPGAVVGAVGGAVVGAVVGGAGGALKYFLNSWF